MQEPRARRMAAPGERQPYDLVGTAARTMSQAPEDTQQKVQAHTTACAAVTDGRPCGSPASNFQKGEWPLTCCSREAVRMHGLSSHDAQPLCRWIPPQSPTGAYRTCKPASRLCWARNTRWTPCVLSKRCPATAMLILRSAPLLAAPCCMHRLRRCSLHTNAV